MKKTNYTGRQCVGELRLAKIDVGWDIRLDDVPVILPARFESVGLDKDGATWLVQGTRDEMIAAIKEAGYRVKDGRRSR